MLHQSLPSKHHCCGCPNTAFSARLNGRACHQQQKGRNTAIVQAEGQGVELLAKPVVRRPAPPPPSQEDNASGTNNNNNGSKSSTSSVAGNGKPADGKQAVSSSAVEKVLGERSKPSKSQQRGPQHRNKKSQPDHRRVQSNQSQKKRQPLASAGQTRENAVPDSNPTRSQDGIPVAGNNGAVPRDISDGPRIEALPESRPSRESGGSDVEAEAELIQKPLKRPQSSVRSDSAKGALHAEGRLPHSKPSLQQPDTTQSRPKDASQTRHQGVQNIARQEQLTSDVPELGIPDSKPEGSQPEKVGAPADEPETSSQVAENVPELSAKPVAQKRQVKRRLSMAERSSSSFRATARLSQRSDEATESQEELASDQTKDIRLDQNGLKADNETVREEPSREAESQTRPEAPDTSAEALEVAPKPQLKKPTPFTPPNREEAIQSNGRASGDKQDLARREERPSPSEPSPSFSDSSNSHRPSTLPRRRGGHVNKLLPVTGSMDEAQVTASMDNMASISVTETLDMPETDSTPTDAAQPVLSIRPSLRDAKEKRDIHRRAIHGALKRVPSEKRSSQFVREPKPEDQQYSSAWRQRGNEASSTPQTAQTSDSRGRKKSDKNKRQSQYQKIDIEKQRASRVERRQQRREQSELAAPEQEEIFEVGSEGMSVQELADRLACNSGDVLKALFMQGIMAQVNQVLDKEMVKTVAEEYGVEVLDLEEARLEDMAKKTVDYDSDDDVTLLLPRPPVVTVMGHVDHGKTSLLDYVRKAKVAAGEAGGITQAIGAYTCEVQSGGEPKNITFLDTPGHEAFSAMRARGTRVTDIAIIVVAADDGVRPQTKEAISHAKAAEVPIIVAINKIDKEGANIERAKQEISEAGLLPEEWGGTTQMVPISAKKGDGVDDLLEVILLVAEVEQLVANPARMARGTIVEATMDRRKGPAATVLVGTGTLRVGDIVHAGATLGKVRSLMASNGESVQEAGPSVAVQMLGLNAVPAAGDEFGVVDSEQTARRIAEEAENKNRLRKLDEQAGGSMVTSATFATQSDETSSGLQFLNIILKGDSSGSVEAVKSALLQLPQDRVALRFLLATTGDLNNGDVQLASASQANIIGFNMEPSDALLAQVKQAGVALKSYKVIYELIDDIRALMEGRLDAVEDRTLIGEAEVRAVFGTGNKKVAGCMVTDGKLKRDSMAVVIRNQKEVFEGQLASLRRVKESVNEISYGNECGVGVTGFIDWRQGDKIQAFEVQSKRQTLEEASDRKVYGDFSNPQYTQV